MKFKEVDAFRAVMRSGSMTAAAADLHTSQPNISRLISQMESSTKLRLFHRAAGRLTPTEEAIALFQEVERAFVGMKSGTELNRSSHWLAEVRPEDVGLCPPRRAEPATSSSRN